MNCPKYVDNLFYISGLGDFLLLGPQVWSFGILLDKIVPIVKMTCCFDNTILRKCFKQNWNRKYKVKMRFRKEVWIQITYSKFDLLHQRKRNASNHKDRIFWWSHCAVLKYPSVNLEITGVSPVRDKTMLWPQQSTNGCMYWLKFWK